MKAKLNFRSKRTIIVAAIIAALGVTAGVGGYFFIKGNNEAAATDGNQNAPEQTVVTPADEQGGNNNDQTNPPANPDDNANPADNGNQDADGDGNANPAVPDGGNANPVAPDGGNANPANNPGGNAGNNPANNPGGNAGNNPGGNAGNAGAQNNDGGDATVVQEVVTETIVVEQPWESHETTWTPETFELEGVNADVTLPNLTSEKVAKVEGTFVSKDAITTVVQNGGKITYTIKVTNKGETKANKVMVYDTIPENTVLDREFEITNGGKLENGRIVWEKDIEGGATEEFSFRIIVEINKEETDTEAESVDLNMIENTAKVNGKDTDKTETPVIEAVKKASLVENGKVVKDLEEGETVKVGQIIRYTITATNSSKVDGKTTIVDTVPEGTTLEKAEGAEKTEKENEDGSKTVTLEWKNIDVKANDEASVYFDVKVDAKTEKTIKNKANVAGTDTPEITNKVANITTKKTSVGSEENLHEFDEITYTLTATNTGDGEGTVIISDTVPEGTTLVKDSIKVGNKVYTEKQLNDGIELTVAPNKGTATITFVVTINPFVGETITIRNATAKQDGTIPIDPTEDPVTKEKTSKVATKVWEDNNNKLSELNLRKEITFDLYADNVKTDKSLTLNAENVDEQDPNKWTVEFKDLNKYTDEGTEIVYTVKEVGKVDHYNKNEKGLIVTNTLDYTTFKTEITATKVWNDTLHIDETRPESIKFELYANNKPTGTIKTLNSKNADEEDSNKWTVKFDNLLQYDENLDPITYSVKELDADENAIANEGTLVGKNNTIYTVTYDGNTITNTVDYTSVKTKVPVEKEWKDELHKDETRPDSITVALYEGNVASTQSGNKTLNEGNEWKEEFTNLKKYNEKGELISYTVKELDAEGKAIEANGTLVGKNNAIYTVTYEGNKIINTVDYTSVKTKVPVEKEWKDELHKDETRPDSITVALYEGNVASTQSGNKTLNEGNEWKEEFTNLKKYNEKGELISYTVKELDAEGKAIEANGTLVGKNNAIYTVTYEGNKIINTVDYTSVKTKVPVEKEWKDELHKDETRPDSITVALYEGNAASTQSGNKTLNEGNEWKEEFTNLKKYNEKGELISYTVKELDAEGKAIEANGTLVGKNNAIYTVTYEGNKIINTVDYTSVKTKVPVEKEWKDELHKDETRPTSITVALYEGNVASTQSGNKTLNEGNEWKEEFTNLKKYNEKGELISYTVKELDADGKAIEANGTLVGKNNAIYTVTYEGNKIINTVDYTSVKTKVPFNKVWEDGEHADETRPTSITVALFEGNTASTQADPKTVNSGNEWKGEFTGLKKYDSEGTLINYSVKELDAEGNAIANGGKLIGKGGAEYKVTYSGNTITNTVNYTSVLTEVEVSKVWHDLLHDEETRPTSITFKLYAGTTDTGITLTLDASKEDTSNEGVWTDKITGLSKYDQDGNLIKYTIKEVDKDNKVVEDGKTFVGENGAIYTARYSDDGLTVANTVDYTSVKISVPFNKVWVDEKHADETRPTSITVGLFEGNTASTQADPKTVNSGNEWKGEFTGLKKYDSEGTLINYSVKELDAEGKAIANEGKLIGKDGAEYKVTYSGNTITNTVDYTSVKTKVPFNKVWVDEKHADETRPTSITVGLFEGNTASTQADPKTVNSGNEWKGEFTGLKKYDSEGTLINYSVKELDAEGKAIANEGKLIGKGGAEYKVTYSGNTITNTVDYTSVKTEVEVSKVWHDLLHDEETRPTSITFKLYAGTTDTGITLTLDASKEDTSNEGVWTDKITGLSKYDQDGNLIKYTIKEVDKDNKVVEDGKTFVGENGAIYTAKYSDDGLTVANTVDYTSIKEDLKVVKNWNYTEGQKVDGEVVTLPANLKLEVNNGTSTETKTLTGTGNKWETTYTVSKYDKDGNELTYTINEKDVEHFVQESRTVSNNTTTFENTLPSISIDKKVISITKGGETTDVSTMEEEKINVTPGTVVEYQLIVTNGKIDLTNVKVIDNMTNGKDLYTSYNKETNTLSNKVVNGIVKEYSKLTANTVDDTIRVYYKVETADVLNNTSKKIPNTASVTGKYTDNKGTERTLSDEDQALVAVLDTYTLEVTKHQAVDGKSVNDNETTVKVKPGSVITYTMTIKNTGNITQEDIVVTDVMNLNGNTRDDLKVADMTIDSAHQLVDGKIKSLASGDTATITATYTVQEADMSETASNTIKNTVSANGFTDEVTITTETWKADIDVEKNGELYQNGTWKDITNTAEPTRVEYGDKIRYSIVVENSGNKPVDVKVWDDILTRLGSDLELVNNEIKVVNENGTTIATLSAEDKANFGGEEGYILRNVGKGKAIITFTVEVKAYAGTMIANVAKFQVLPDGEIITTNEVDADAEDTAYVVSTTNTSTKVPQKVILVLDYSTSMDDKINGVKKITSLRSAVNTFLTKYFESNENNEVMVITYGTDVIVRTADVTYSWGREIRTPKFVKSKDEAYSSLPSSVNNNQGTNMVGGLREALKHLTAADAENTSVILMTDGIAGFKYDAQQDKCVPVYDSNGHSGYIYMEEAGNSTKEAAALIKNVGPAGKKVKLFTIGFGLTDANAKQMLDDCATDDTADTKYYYEAADNDKLAEAFDKVVNSVINNAPVDYDTVQGEITITEGFEDGQNVEVYTKYDANDSTKCELYHTYSWSEFINLNNGKTGDEYVKYTTTVTNSQGKVTSITFKYGQFMKDNGIPAEKDLTFRFVKPTTN